MQYWGSLCYNYNTGHGRILPVFAVSLKEGVSLFLPQVQNMYRTCPCTCSKTTKIVATENLLCLLRTFIDFKIQTHQENGDGPQGYAEIL